jgi:hypothetical protein
MGARRRIHLFRKLTATRWRAEYVLHSRQIGRESILGGQRFPQDLSESQDRSHSGLVQACRIEEVQIVVEQGIESIGLKMAGRSYLAATLFLVLVFVVAVDVKSNGRVYVVSALVSDIQASSVILWQVCYFCIILLRLNRRSASK